MKKNPPLRTVTYQIVKGATKYGPVMIFRTARTEDVFAKETSTSLLGD